LEALLDNVTGNNNTAGGYLALTLNSAGSNNSALGYEALWSTSTGNNNTGVGTRAGTVLDGSGMTGSNNTFLGSNADVSTYTLTDVTAVGANAEVAASNAMVLGSINGVNGATASTNVGIGTTTPGATLEVDGSANQYEVFIKAPETGVGAGLDFFTTGSGGLQWEILDTGATSAQGANKLNIRNANTAHDVLTLTASGAVGINVTSPDNTLTVNGSADKPGGGSWGTYSDRRLKTLNGSFRGGLSQILQISPVRYRYKEENAMGIRDRQEHVGLVAQDVQKVIPEAVTENNKGYLLVNNDPIIWSMLNAIKEQQKEFEQQQAVVRTQAVAIRNLKSELRATRQSLQKVKAQVVSSQFTVVAAK
jgi:trimeric autotransporter adhesin